MLEGSLVTSLRRLRIQPWRRDTGGTESTEMCIRTAKAVSLVLPIKVLDGG